MKNVTIVIDNVDLNVVEKEASLYILNVQYVPIWADGHACVRVSVKCLHGCHIRAFS